LPKLHLLALDSKTGRTVWRYAEDRFVASVLGADPGNPTLWYVAGDASDPNALTLRRIDVRSGDNKAVLTWRRPERIEQAWISAAPGRIFVATAFPNTVARTVDVGIDAIDITTARVVWTKNIGISNATTSQMGQPISVFAAQNTTLNYTIGSERATLLASTGTAAITALAVGAEPAHKVENDIIAEDIEPKTGRVLAKHPILWRPMTFRIEADRFYAFTEDGRAYAMNP
jgi:hypothetical protein